VRGVPGNAPRLAGAQLARLVGNPEHQRAAEADAELLVLMAVLGHDAPWIELDHAQRDPLAVDGSAVHAVPDALEVERGEVAEGAHAARAYIATSASRR
jgi:hypothetical protein